MNTQDGSTTPSTSNGHGSISLKEAYNPETTTSSRPTSEFGFPFRRSNASLSAFFASNPATSALSKRASSPIVGLPRRSSRTEPSLPSAATVVAESPNEYRNLIVRSFGPHVAILPSRDTEDLLAQKGLPNGLLSLLRPFGDNVSGKITIRDSSGSSKSCEDFAVHFTRLKDGLEAPRIVEEDGEPHIQNISSYLDKQFPESSARLRTGGDLGQIEDAVKKHMLYSTSDGRGNISSDHDGGSFEDELHYESPFSIVYLRRLLSGLPVTTHETFSHPVACVLAVSSRTSDPIEELRQLAASTRTGEDRLPTWVSSDYLRYYILLHDEEHDDNQRSTSLFEQMKRHFGLHCHLLRIRSTQCVPSDDDCVRLPICEWQSAAEELFEINRREGLDDFDPDTSPCIYESDAAAVRALVRELTTQSIIPFMERQCAQWNDQIVSRRRGISGRFLSFSKKWTSPFAGGGRSLSSPFSSGSASPKTDVPTSSSNSNYDSLRGIYPSDTPEHLMRKLADYAFMLRDYKLSQLVYDMLRSDYYNDKAWKYHAGALEFTAIASLLTGLPPSKSRSPDYAPDALLATASAFYVNRCFDSYASLRALAVGAELMQLRAQATGNLDLARQPAPGQLSVTPDDTVRCISRIIEMQLVGQVGYALTCERAAACLACRTGTGSRRWGARRRKAAFWNTLAAEHWLQLDRDQQAARCLTEVIRLYGADRVVTMTGCDLEVQGPTELNVAFRNIQAFVLQLRELLQQRIGADVLIFTAPDVDAPDEAERQSMLERTASHDIEAKSSRKSFSLEVTEPSSIRSPGERKTGVIFEAPNVPLHEPKSDTNFSSATANNALGPPPTPVAVADKPDIRKHRRSMSKVALGMVAESGNGQSGGDTLGVSGVQVPRTRTASKATDNPSLR